MDDDETGAIAAFSSDPVTISRPTAVIPDAAPRWRIVLIDDHERSRALVEATIAAAGGATIARADSAAAGVELVEHLRPDAVVLAVGLPDRDGVDAAAEIMRRVPCPIVLLTSRAGPTLVRRANAAGVMAYLLKPLRAEELEPAIELAIARFAELMAANRETAALRRTLADRKLILSAQVPPIEQEKIAEVLAHVALLERASERAGTLSHGQQQWLEIGMLLGVVATEGDRDAFRIDEVSAYLSV